MTLTAILAVVKAAWKARKALAQADKKTDAHRDKLKAAIIKRGRGENAK